MLRVEGNRGSIFPRVQPPDFSLSENATAPAERILVVEDDRAVQKALRRLFEAERFSVEISADGQSALEAFRRVAPAAIVLDLRLPLMSGQRRLPGNQEAVSQRSHHRAQRHQRCFRQSIAPGNWRRRLRHQAFQSARAFGPGSRGPAARHSRRRSRRSRDLRRHCSGLHAKWKLMRDGEPVVLTAQEFKTLKFLVQNPERVITRDELLNEVWGYQNYPSTRTVDNHILKLRQKLERDPANPVHFRTVHGVGYKFVP